MSPVKLQATVDCVIRTLYRARDPLLETRRLHGLPWRTERLLRKIEREIDYWELAELKGARP